MFSFLTNLFKSKPKADFGELIRRGAVVVDVRSKGEYQTGHLRGSINIPLNNLGTQISKLKKDKPIITCCASGSRSGAARRVLLSSGFAEVYNAGAWTNLRKYKN